MENIELHDIREKFLKFFESKGHLLHPSYSLIPKNDKSLLLIGAGMAPLKKYFTGEETPPAKRMTTSQKCVRTGDIDMSERRFATLHSLRCLETSALETILKQKQYIGHGSF